VKAVETNLLKFMQGTKQFIIPIYQRKYSWTIKQCRQLWNDIVRAAEDEKIKGHFVGSIVYIDPHAANAAPADDENGRMRYNIPAAGGGRSLFLGAASPTLRRTPTTRCTTDCRSFGKHAG